MGLELVGKVATAFFFEQVIVLKRITASNDYLIFFFITLIHFTFYYFYLIFLKFFLEEIDVGKIKELKQFATAETLDDIKKEIEKVDNANIAINKKIVEYCENKKAYQDNIDNGDSLARLQEYLSYHGYWTL